MKGEGAKRGALASASFDPSLLTKEGLVLLKRRALRSKAWFRLDRLERAVVDLTIKVVDRVRSSTLAKIILGIVGKLRQWIKPSLEETALSIGRPLAHRAARIAEAWGNREAKTWLRDLGFILYLGVSWLNTPKALRCTT
jgi:hypothetical protein